MSSIVQLSEKYTAAGNFSIDDGDGSQNVTFKLNSPFFKLSRVNSKSLKMSNVGAVPWS